MNEKGSEWELHYDPANVLARQIDIAYDARNHVSSLNKAGSITQQVIDAVGNLAQVTDPNQVALGSGISTNHSYDALNRLIQSLNNANGTSSFGYDSGDRLTQVTAPNNATTQYVYDDLGNLLKEISPDRGTLIYTYDSAGNRKGMTDGRSIVANYSYDALNRLTNISYPAATGENVTLTYDTATNCTLGKGRLCQIVDESGTTRYAYDAFGNVLTQTKIELSRTYTTRYTYDAGNRVLTLTAPDNRVITYSRDSVGRITQVTATVSGTARTIASNRTYRPDGLLLTQTYGNSLNEVRTYNNQGQLTYQSLGTADTRVYTYDPNGNLTQKQALPEVGNYTYDSLDRLTQDGITTTNTSNEVYTYDPNGNRTKKGTTNYTYTANTNRLAQVGGTALTYDASGNILTNGTARYTYSNANRLKQAYSGSTLKGTYTYNYLGQRTRKVAGSTTTVYHYDLDGNLLLETSNTATTRVFYISTDGTPVGQVNRSGTTDTLTYLHADYEGTPRLGTNSSRSVVWRFEGRAFGDTNPTGSATVNLRYPGQYFDSESSLFYNWNRYYDPKIGRPITADPMSVAEHFGRWQIIRGIPKQSPFESNPFVYVANNPLKYIDSTGEAIVNPVTIGAVIGGISGAVQAANAGGGWTSANAWNIVVGAATGAGAGALAGFLPGSAGWLAGARVGAIAGAAGNASGQWLGGTPIQCTDFKQVATQGTIGALSGGLGYAAGLSSALRIVRAGGSSAGATAFGDVYGSLSGGATQIYANLPIPTDLGGFFPSPNQPQCGCSM